MCQWQSMYDILGREITSQNGANTIASEGQSYTLTKDSSGNSTMTIKINGSKEFPQSRPDSWPHAVVETDLYENVAITELDKFVMDMEFTVDAEKKQVSSNMNNIAAQDACLLSVTFVLQNLTATDPGYGEDMIWFQCDLWDYRTTTWNSNIHIDGNKPDASSKPIYTVPTSVLMDGRPYQVTKEGNKQIGETRKISVDLLPQMLYAAEKCLKSKYFKSGTTLDDFRVSLFSLYFEAWDTIDASLTFSDLSCKAYFKDGHDIRANTPYANDFKKPIASYGEWYVENARSVWKTGDGALTRTGPQLPNDRITLMDYTYKDFEIEFDMKHMDSYYGDQSWFGLSYRRQGTVPGHTEWGGGNLLTVTKTGEMEIGCHTTRDKKSAQIPNYKEKGWNHYKIVVEGNKVKVFVDDEELLNWTDTSNLYANGGQIAFMGSHCNVSVKNLSITPFLP